MAERGPFQRLALHLSTGLLSTASLPEDLWSFPPGSVSSATPQVCARPLITSLLNKAPSYGHLCAHLLSGPSQPLRTGRRFKDYLLSRNVLLYS